MHKRESKNVHEDLYKHKELFDFGNYPKDWKYYIGANNLVAGKIKDEKSGVSIKGFVWLKSKNCIFIAKDMK